MARTQRIIFDTDIGTDVDDCLALALILSSPELQLEGVTCVYGDVDLRARMVIKLLRLRNHPELPVMVGASEPLLGLRPVFWPGHEGLGLLEPEDEAIEPDR
jgi:purine nucleosidase